MIVPKVVEYDTECECAQSSERASEQVSVQWGRLGQRAYALIGHRCRRTIKAPGMFPPRKGLGRKVLELDKRCQEGKG